MRKVVLAICALAAGCSGGGDNERAEAPATPSEAFAEPPAGAATAATAAANAAVAERLPLSAPSDFEDAARGLLAQIEEDAIVAEDGAVVWDIAGLSFLEGDAPDTVNPSLWRQSQLTAQHGLYEVVDGLYQVRGYDLSVMSVIRGESGWIVVDPLLSAEAAAASMKLVNDTLGERPVTGVLYTHSHADHFGGVRGVIDEADAAARGVPILAPNGFSEAAVTENLLAGAHMSRRATLMFGRHLPLGETGHVGSGLGPGTAGGAIGLILPTEEVGSETRMVDGVRFDFVNANGTEAPAEFMFYLPQFKALCTAEVATATFHNALTLRGAKVRDTLRWSEVIDEVLVKYGGEAELVFASHHWPTWGTENVEAFLRSQRDIYRYSHDQTLRRANIGGTIVENAEALSEPDLGEDAFDARGYYGTLNHNAKAVYQHYFGWWGGVPAEYNRLPHEVTAARYVEAMGGTDAVLELGQEAFAAGDYRWAAEVFNHVVFADPENKDARDWLSATYEQLGFQAESGAWRSYYLTGAAELRRGLPNVGNPQLGNADFLKAVPSIDLFDALAARFNPAKMKREPFTVVFEFPDSGETVSLLVGDAVLVPREGSVSEPTATVTIDRFDFDRLILQEARPLGLITAGKMKISGNRGAVSAMFDALDQPDFWFNTVTP